MKKVIRIMSILFSLVFIYCSFSLLAVASWGYDTEESDLSDGSQAEETGIVSQDDTETLAKDYKDYVMYYESSGAPGVPLDPDTFDFEALWNSWRPLPEGPWTPYQELMDEMVNDRFGFHISVPYGEYWEKSNIVGNNMSLEDYKNWLEEWFIPFCQITYDANAIIIEEEGLEYLHIQKPRELLNQEP